MNSFYKIALTGLVFSFSSSAFAHKAGMYTIDKKENAKLMIAAYGVCPTISGALKGRLKTFTFSEMTVRESYGFQSGFYVEVHDASGNEVYVKTDFNCVPVSPAVGIAATSNTMNGFAIELSL